MRIASLPMYDAAPEAVDAWWRAIARALQDVEGIFLALMGKMNESLYHVGLHGNRVLFALAELVIGWLLVRHAAVALARLGNAVGDDRDYYDGKVASARFFCANVLPGIAFSREVIDSGSLALMDVRESAF